MRKVEKIKKPAVWGGTPILSRNDLTRLEARFIQNWVIGKSRSVLLVNLTMDSSSHAAHCNMANEQFLNGTSS